MRDKDAGILTVRGLSLSDFGIFDGDQLLVKHRPSWTEITEDTVCIVLIHSTGEVVAKRIERGANTLILKASGGGIPDMEYGIDEIEIRSIVIKALFDIDTLISRAREAKVRLNSIGRRRNRDELTQQLVIGTKKRPIYHIDTLKVMNDRQKYALEHPIESAVPDAATALRLSAGRAIRAVES
jgi:hypothetical protein